MVSCQTERPEKQFAPRSAPAQKFSTRPKNLVRIHQVDAARTSNVSTAAISFPSSSFINESYVPIRSLAFSTELIGNEIMIR